MKTIIALALVLVTPAMAAEETVFLSCVGHTASTLFGDTYNDHVELKIDLKSRAFSWSVDSFHTSKECGFTNKRKDYFWESCSHVTDNDLEFSLRMTSLADTTEGTINRVTGSMYMLTHHWRFPENVSGQEVPDGFTTRYMTCKPAVQRF